jgi:hypothetical protein
MYVKIDTQGGEMRASERRMRGGEATATTATMR